MQNTKNETINERIRKNTTYKRTTWTNLCSEISFDFIWNNINDNSKDALAFAVQNDAPIVVEFCFHEPVAVWLDQEMVD